MFFRGYERHVTCDNTLMSDMEECVVDTFRVDAQLLNSSANVAIPQAGLGNRAPSHI
jgi:hypothetical protein